MAARKQAKSLDARAASTIVYIHGIGNKPTEDVLRCQWDHALMGFGLGERSRMAYWCQRDRHGAPLDETCRDGDRITPDAEGGGHIAAKALREGRTLDEWVEALPGRRTGEQTLALQRLASRMAGGAPAAGARPRGRRARATTVRAEGLGDEWNAPDFLTRFVTRLFLVDVNDFFFDRERRERMKDSLRRRFAPGGGPFVLVAHSQGTMIAYATLLEYAAADLDVELFLTIGSPLGLEETRDQLVKMGVKGARERLPVPACVKRWVNVYDSKDPVAQNTGLASFYLGDIGVEDVNRDNLDHARDAHSATGYLGLADARQRVRARIDLDRFQRVASFTRAADLVAAYERRPEGERHKVLIELTDPAWALEETRRLRSEDAARATAAKAPPTPVTTAQMSDALLREIRRVVPKQVDDETLGVQRLRRYLSVNLTREECERLAYSPPAESLGLAVKPLYRMWRNAKKRPQLDQSVHTVQASAAHAAYQALGQGIHWAVLDSGCSPHPHFDAHDNVVARWDCTLVSDEPVAHGATSRGGRRADAHDHFGHGTHVAGIIAGRYEHPTAHGPRVLSGMAPRARLHVYKVLGDDGEGDDAWIIKAIDHVASINERAGAPVIAGVNLSLGGPYDQNVFGCGHTPLCAELRRLWRQGVVVVLAAGNEGYVTLVSSEGDIDANLAYTIGDPANLDEAIAVGAVHKEKPHTYGVSSFSSRGPTVDGRSKPDCVAPGERILSCRHDARAGARRLDQLYVRLDGTSMAAPHVSGVIAAFLSRRREFVGEADRVKKILLENCTDLDRNRLQQGAGMPNLVKMLVET